MMQSMIGLAAVLLITTRASGEDKLPPPSGPVITLSIDGWGEIKASGREQLIRSPRDLKEFLAKVFEDNRTKKEGQPAVIISAHKETEYDKIFKVLHACSNAGFRNLKVRAWAAGVDDNAPKRPPSPGPVVKGEAPAFTVILSATDPTKTGTIGRLRIVTAAKTEEIDGAAWEKPFRERLKKYHPRVEGKTPCILLEADDALRWRELDKVTDVAHTEGYAVSFKPPREEGGRVPK